MKAEERLLQNPVEWKLYLEFIQAYFRNKEIEHPVVVELGVYKNAQREFYKNMLGAVHIGIDSKTWDGQPDIVGDTRNVATLVKLREMLAGRRINLLFIDADHGYGSAKIELEFYGPIVENIIAFHDVCEPELGVSRLWNEIFADKLPWTKMIFYGYGTNIHYVYGKDNMLVPRMGIGLLIKD